MEKLKLTKKYEKYPGYKDSKIEWLGQIPKAWKLEKLKYAAPQITQKVAKEKQEGIYVALENVESKTGKHIPSAEVVEPESIVNTFENTDVLFGKLRPYLAKVFAPTFSGISTGEFLVLRPQKQITKKYLFYRLLSQEFINTVNDSTYGSQMPRANWDFVGGLAVTLPTLGEQQEIAKFLDEKALLIDGVIEKKQKQIELLREKRTAVINHAVTKGLDPKAELVDSGIDWLGKVSKEFKTIDLRYLVKISTGGKDTANAVEDGVFPFFVRSPHIEQINSYSFDGEAVLTAGDGAGVGKVFHYFNGKFDYHQRVYCFSSFRKISGKFFYYYLMSNLKRVVLMGESKSTVDSIRQPQLLGLPVVVPSKDDQIEIVTFLDKKTQLHDKAIKQVEQSIELLQEFKSSLISHVVTGKIKI